MRVLLLASHAVAEYDDLRMFTDLGFDCFAPGGYEVPSRSGEGIRPALPDAPHHPELVARLNEVRAERGEPGRAIDWGKAVLHDDIIDWADVIIVHHFPEQWIGGQWERIRHKRVIWRTCGQSNPMLEEYLSGFKGLQVVRYSPAERRYFERKGHFAGEDALIRFGKYPDDYGPWRGDDVWVANLTQDLVKRGDSCGYPFWQAATDGLPAMPAGKGSEKIGGYGSLSYAWMLDYLRSARAYLYTGTRPASYTLGLIEAMLSGVPVVSIGAQAWGGDWDGADLFEAHEIVGHWGSFDRPAEARDLLRFYLDNPPDPAGDSARMRRRAIELFGIETIGAQWKAFLS
ncbi:MAG TPA: hypothetical protein VM121_08620 [Acidimicrobiales bacterium]|nr:hypothetical protein [Acidimicrobiales bacterium]